MKILVTGGAGFIGSAVVRLAIARGHEIINLDALTYAASLESVASVENHQNYKWFDKQYSQYKPNIEKLSKTNLKNIDIAIFMGTWCHDSKREVPRAIKLFNLLALENERIKIVALNKQKKGYFKNYKSFNIKRTPTIIFYKNRKEIGRII